MVRQHLRQIALTLSGSLTLLLASCGGGSDAPATTSAFPPSSSLANVCTLEGQKNFVRSYMDEAYLWYDEIPAVNPADYTTVPSYFSALLVKPKDHFSAVLPSNLVNSL